MRAVVQRVTTSSVSVDGKITGEIQKGLTILLGVHEEDTEKDMKYMAEKIVNLRVFEDEEDVMNLSLLDIKGQALIISQFTLLGDVRKGRRPSYSSAAKPDAANKMYEDFCELVSSYGLEVAKGVFQADMLVDIKNDGPVTILLDSHKNF